MYMSFFWCALYTANINKMATSSGHCDDLPQYDNVVRHRLHGHLTL